MTSGYKLLSTQVGRVHKNSLPHPTTCIWSGFWYAEVGNRNFNINIVFTLPFVNFKRRELMVSSRSISGFARRSLHCDICPCPIAHHDEDKCCDNPAETSPKKRNW